jgi:hypothetical protein
VTIDHNAHHRKAEGGSPLVDGIRHGFIDCGVEMGAREKRCAHCKK